MPSGAVHPIPKVLAWLGRHPRWTFHFTPTSCSWLNAVETFFSKLTRRRLRRGTFPSLVALQEAINRFVAEHNREPKPFVWTADPDLIVEKVRRGYHALASLERRAG
jgi:transposase